jgi:hypothetical protein
VEAEEDPTKFFMQKIQQAVQTFTFIGTSIVILYLICHPVTDIVRSSDDVVTAGAGMVLVAMDIVRCEGIRKEKQQG